MSPTLTADVCVIGAGAGGAVVAAELAEGGASVILLEQGPEHDADNFTAPFFGEGNVLGNNYSNSTITGTLIPSTAAESDRSATDDDYGKLQDIVADQLPVLPVWQAKQYAVTRDDVYGLEYCLDASTVFRFWELSKG